MSLPQFQLFRPHTVEEAIELLAKHAPGVQILAGGTDVLPAMRQRLRQPRTVMDVRGIDEIRGIRVRPGEGVEIGALTTLASIEDSGYIERNYPVLRHAAMQVASPLVRNTATLGGNLCLETRCAWYNQPSLWRKACGPCRKAGGAECYVGDRCTASFVGDTAAALLCVGAALEIASPRGMRGVALKDFYSGDGAERVKLFSDELITRIILPEETAGYRGAYVKLSGAGAYSVAAVAVALKMNGTIEDARVAVNAVGPAPALVKPAEHALAGRAVDEHVASVVGELAAQAAQPAETAALSAAYRREMVRVLARRAVLQAARPEEN